MLNLLTECKMSPAGPLQAIPSTAASSAPETQQASFTPAVCVWPMLWVTQHMAALLKTSQKASGKPSVMKTHQSVRQKPEWKEKMQGWRRRCTCSFFIVIAQQRGTLRCISEHKWPSVNIPCVPVTRTICQLQPLSWCPPVHNLSLKWRRAGLKAAERRISRERRQMTDGGARCIMVFKIKSKQNNKEIKKIKQNKQKKIKNKIKTANSNKT